MQPRECLASQDTIPWVLNVHYFNFSKDRMNKNLLSTRMWAYAKLWQPKMKCGKFTGKENKYVCKTEKAQKEQKK